MGKRADREVKGFDAWALPTKVDLATVWMDAKQICIEGLMVTGAENETVARIVDSVVRPGTNVDRVEDLLLLNPTHRTPRAVSAVSLKDKEAESALSSKVSS